MIGWYKAKESYKSLDDNESFKLIAELKHQKLLDGEIVEVNSNPRLLKNDLSEHLEACEEPSTVIEESPKEESSKSVEPSSEWTKDELKAYMDSNEIEYNSGDTKLDLLDKINAEGGDE